MTEGRFQDQTVLITGAASGFGALAAQCFAAEGARLVLSDLSAVPLRALAGRLEDAGHDVMAETVDVTEEPAVASHITRALDRFHTLDVAINNAGIGGPVAPLTQLDAVEFDRIMAVNARGVFLGLKHQLPPMIAAGKGAILNVASAAGLVGAGHLAGYAASKHAVVGLTRAAADEVAGKGVRVNAICPSFTATPLFDAMADAVAERQGVSRDEAYGRISARIPMRRVARPEEVVQAMLWACDPANSFMTGQAIAIDGGLTAI